MEVGTSWDDHLEVTKMKVNVNMKMKKVMKDVRTEGVCGLRAGDGRTSVNNSAEKFEAEGESEVCLHAQPRERAGRPWDTLHERRLGEPFSRWPRSAHVAGPGGCQDHKAAVSVTRPKLPA